MPKGTAAVVAIIGIVVLEVVAICKGLDGVALASSVGVIAGLGGFTVGKFLIKGG